ncbi:acyltransferase [Aliifodinibius sp. S!AR15-10]|uniref:acyltransferase n=1 Tax=Aliifodinibius sp. S!AR15-10 TaxID=2950437 RepID=UPI00285DF617|nr:acyltransferase [Aliifodinibius sp. S!AR15-10]MDR8392613.1 acyltransferase [Aliifodinibius sp. S!AR15-10]
MLKEIARYFARRIGAFFYKLVEQGEKHVIAKENRKLIQSSKNCSPDLRINGRVKKFSGFENAVIEKNVHIGDNVHIRAEGGLFIGENTHISRNFVCYTMNHDYEGKRLPIDDNDVHKPVHIGKNVWIGMNVVVAPGTTIEDGVIVGAGCTVAGHVPALSIIGNPKYRTLKMRDEEHYNRLEREEKYGGISGRPVED